MGTVSFGYSLTNVRDEPCAIAQAVSCRLSTNSFHVCQSMLWQILWLLPYYKILASVFVCQFTKKFETSWSVFSPNFCITSFFLNLNHFCSNNWDGIVLRNRGTVPFREWYHNSGKHSMNSSASVEYIGQSYILHLNLLKFPGILSICSHRSCAFWYR
jgi:hypothetical protein